MSVSKGNKVPEQPDDCDSDRFKVRTTSGGAILNEGIQHMGFSGWEVLFPAVTLATLVLGLTFVGDGLRDAFDTRGE